MEHIRNTTSSNMKNKSGDKHEILLGLTTTPASDWRGKVEEMKKFGIKRIALFPTFLEVDQRKELYKLLEDIEGLEIPHVHLRNDMELNEIEYFKFKYKSQFFNIHPENNKYSFSEEFLKYADQTYVENLIMIPTEGELNKYAGICLDFSHWENNVRLKKKDYNDPSSEYNDSMLSRLAKFSVGCCHVSSIKQKSYPDNFDIKNPGQEAFDDHLLCELSELDYMIKYQKYLPKYVSIELENSFAEQLKVKAYLEKLLNL